MFRFTIRDMLWVMVVVAMGVMWWGEYRQQMLDSADLRADYRRLKQERDKLQILSEAHRNIVKRAIEEYATQKPSPAKN